MIMLALRLNNLHVPIISLLMIPILLLEAFCAYAFLLYKYNYCSIFVTFLYIAMYISPFTLALLASPLACAVQKYKNSSFLHLISLLDLPSYQSTSIFVCNLAYCQYTNFAVYLPLPLKHSPFSE